MSHLRALLCPDLSLEAAQSALQIPMCHSSAFPGAPGLLSLRLLKRGQLHAKGEPIVKGVQW